MQRELRLFLTASAVMGLGAAIFDATFNNFLHERFGLSGLDRSILELPRETPGMLTVVAAAVLGSLFCSRRLAAVAMLFCGLGMLLMGSLSPTFPVVLVWLFVYSLGQHLMIAMNAAIGLELSADGQAGKRLGQLNSLRNLSAVAGSLVVAAAFQLLSLGFVHTFILAAAAFVTAAVLLFTMKPTLPVRARDWLRPRREYRSYYVLAVLYGTRKQIFLTFAPWVLVSVLRQPVQTMATLLLIGGVAGIVIQPFLGRAIDRHGERTVLAWEGGLLVVVCLAYALAPGLLGPAAGLVVCAAAWLLDQVLMSMNMARSTYMKKLARRPEDLTPALTLAVSIDHIFSIVVALGGGLLWTALGWQSVFVMGAGLAVVNLIVALRLKLPTLPSLASAPEHALDESRPD